MNSVPWSYKSNTIPRVSICKPVSGTESRLKKQIKMILLMIKKKSRRPKPRRMYKNYCKDNVHQMKKP